jgi:hypothetical protein
VTWALRFGEMRDGASTNWLALGTSAGRRAAHVRCTPLSNEAACRGDRSSIRTGASPCSDRNTDSSRSAGRHRGTEWHDRRAARVTVLRSRLQPGLPRVSASGCRQAVGRDEWLRLGGGEPGRPLDPMPTRHQSPRSGRGPRALTGAQGACALFWAPQRSPGTESREGDTQCPRQPAA